VVDTTIIRERRNKYGDSFPIIASLWNNYINNCMSAQVVREADVATMLALLKLARLANAPEDADSLQDLINYLWIAFNYEDYKGGMNGPEH